MQWAFQKCCRHSQPCFYSSPGARGSSAVGISRSLALYANKHQLDSLPWVTLQFTAPRRVQSSKGFKWGSSHKALRKEKRITCRLECPVPCATVSLWFFHWCQGCSFYLRLGCYVPNNQNAHFVCSLKSIVVTLQPLKLTLAIILIEQLSICVCNHCCCNFAPSEKGHTTDITWEVQVNLLENRIPSLTHI